MFSIHDRPYKLCDGISRRELMRIGGLSMLGLSLPKLLEAREDRPASVPPTDKTFGRAKNIIFLYLAGGPPQHETFDPKPMAPVEVRGPFNPISTNVPGVQFCELLPRTSYLADKLAIIRTMSTNDNIHSSSGYWVLTGNKYSGPNARAILPIDRPYFGSIIKRYKPSESLPPLSTVWIPDMMRLNDGVTPAGQSAGMMGSQWDPDRFVGNPLDPGYKVEGFELSDMPPLRLRQRHELLEQIQRHVADMQRSKSVNLFQSYRRQAFDLLTSNRAQDAFAIQKEPEAVRERYGKNRWGQCVLLARRLIEAGVRLVHVQWPREPGDSASDNPLWDTHAQNAERLEDVLCPQFDVGFSALIEDLDQRGLLDETLVVAVGEFGRTPKINAKGGRDHWGSVFSCALAGAGVSGAQVYGASDTRGAYPIQDRVEPGQLTATIYHLLGINWDRNFSDSEGRQHQLLQSDPIFPLIGVQPATKLRAVATGDLNRVPPYDDKMLLNADFANETAIRTFAGRARPRGWRAAPLLESAQEANLGVMLREERAEIGLRLSGGSKPLKIAKGTQAVLAQEVRSPFPGDYTLSIQVRGVGSSREFYETVFLNHFTCRLVFFEFTEGEKSPKDRKVLASVDFQPPYSDVKNPQSEKVELSKRFMRAKGNFSFGLGLGVAIIVEKTSDGPLELAGDLAQQAVVEIDEVVLHFVGKQRDDDIKI